MQDQPLPRTLLPPGAEAMARFLIGCHVVRVLPEGRRVGRIVETEAYLPYDAAAHSFRGPTPRNRALFLGPGHCYVYRAYGTAWMLNVSAEPAGIGAGVLIRALEPLEGLVAMRADRGGPPDRDLARGPGRLATALAIDRSLDGIDLLADGPLFLAPPSDLPAQLGVSTRIGITKDVHRPLRFFVRGSRFVSGPAALNRGAPLAAG